MIDRIKNALRRWLGVCADPLHVSRADLSTLVTRHMEAYTDRMMARDREYREEVKRELRSALLNGIDAQSKMDALAEALGVVVVADPHGNPPRPWVVSVRDYSVLENSRAYIDAVVAASEILSAQRRVFEHYGEVVKKLDIKTTRGRP